MEMAADNRRYWFDSSLAYRNALAERALRRPVVQLIGRRDKHQAAMFHSISELSDYVSIAQIGIATAFKLWVVGSTPITNAGAVLRLRGRPIFFKHHGGDI